MESCRALHFVKGRWLFNVGNLGLTAGGLTTVLLTSPTNKSYKCMIQTQSAEIVTEG